MSRKIAGEKDITRLQELSRYEEALYNDGVSFIAGIDEVGRGPLAGPVAAAAVILPRDFDLAGVDDSKRLSPKKRELLAAGIKSRALAWAIGWCDSDVIDDINILQATKKAMHIAVLQLSIRPEHILIDALSLPGIDVPQTALTGGDALSYSIACASILAKVARDALMAEYDAVYPGYGFSKNKGYGTKAHYDGLDALGPCPIHRKSFLANYFTRGNAWKVSD